MVDRRCKPDASTYNALVLAHIRAGHWRAALQVASRPARPLVTNTRVSHARST